MCNAEAIFPTTENKDDKDNVDEEDKNNKIKKDNIKVARDRTVREQQYYRSLLKEIVEKP